MEVLLIATPTRNSGNVRALREAIIRRGWTLKELEVRDLSLAVTAKGAKVMYQGEEYNPQAVVYRMVGRYMPLLSPILRTWIEQGVCIINSPESTMKAWNKLESTLAFAKAGIPFLDSTIAYPHQIILNAEVEEMPYIVKPILGTKGCRLGFLSNRKEAESYIERSDFYSDGYIVEPIMAQKDLGIDVIEIRAHVVGGKCVAAMKRIPPQGKRFAGNLEEGTNVNLPLDHPSIAIAEKAAQVLDLDFTGIDLLEKNGEWVVSEANSSPGWVGLEEVSHVSIADALYDLIEERVLATKK